MPLDYIYVFLTLLVSFLVTFSATPIVIVLSNKIGAVDIPKDERRVHKNPTPRIGGVAIFYGFMVSVLCFVTHISNEVAATLIGAIIIATVGIVDDVKGIKALYKLIFQIFAALIVAWGGVKIDFLTNFLNHQQLIYLPNWLSVIITVFWLVGITNAINLIDGLDGLATGVSSIVSMALLVLTLSINRSDISVIVIIIAALTGAEFGFLPYNIHPAKIFMGDTGSTFLGFMLACVSVMGVFKVTAIVSFAVPILILGLPIFDTAFAIVRRVLRGKSPISPDRGHLHHKLLDFGFTQRQVVTILHTMTSVLCLTAVVVSIQEKLRGGIILIVSVLILVLFGAGHMFTIHSSDDKL